MWPFAASRAASAVHFHAFTCGRSDTPGHAALTFASYAKPNDALTLTFDTAVKALQQIAVSTWLDAPDNAVTLNVTMAALPDGTSHPATVVLGIPKSNIEVRVTKSDFQKVGP